MDKPSIDTVGREYGVSSSSAACAISTVSVPEFAMVTNASLLPLISSSPVWALSNGLRWSKDGKLQQAWVEQVTGEIDWRDVPTEDSPS